MKSKDSIWLFLLIFFLIIGGIEIFMWNKYTQKQDQRKKEAASANNTTQESNLISYTGESDVPSMYQMMSEGDPSLTDNHSYIFVGDSRYVAMEENKQSNDTFFCENGVGISFLTNNMDKIIALADNNTRIIVGLGVNDFLIGTDEYITVLNDLAEKTDADVYYMLVNPVDDAKCASIGYGIDNSGIDHFNSQIVSNLANSEIKIIDTNSYLKNEGYECGDGLHYDEETTLKIYQYIKVSLNNRQEA